DCPGAPPRARSVPRAGAGSRTGAGSRQALIPLHPEARMPRRACAVLAALVLTFSRARAADFTVTVDARETARGLLHVTQTFTAHPGPMALSYPRWIPGEHGPTGPNIDVAGLVAKAGGRTIAWTRDPIDMHTVRLTVPAGTKELLLAFDFLLDN